MNRPTFLTMTAGAGALSLGLLAVYLGSASPQAAAQADPAASAVPDLLASPKVADVVDAADAFLATLTDQQRGVARVELKPQLAVRWTFRTAEVWMDASCRFAVAFMVAA